MSAKIVIDQDECIGCGACEELCPDAFEMNSEDKAGVKEDVDPDQECVDEAIASCPAGCISKE